MNGIPITQISTNKFFSEDSYIFENLFFIPKNLPIMDYHINLLKRWNIENIYSEGILLDIPKEKTGDEESAELEDLFSSSENVIDVNSAEISPVKEEIPAIKGESEFLVVYKRWIINTISFFNSILTSKTIDKEKVLNLINEIKSTVKTKKNEVLKMFGKPIEGIPHFYRKTIETVVLAYIMAESMNITEFACSNLLFATLFHDIGMLKVPKEILQKKETLSDTDHQEIQNHTIYGYKFLREVGYSAIIASGALQHHERIDGKGYPNKVPADKITEIAKIIAVVDAYCAAISDKPFKDPLHAKEAVQDLLRSGGTAYDPSILRELVKNISFYPIGSFILLSNGLPAEIWDISGVAMRPLVRLITKEGYGEIIDLSKNNDIYIKGIYQKKDK